MELVLSGIFLLRKKELDWLYEGKGANFVFPEEWAAFEAPIKFSLAFFRIENHYFLNQGFFPRDGWHLEKDNLNKIHHIPTMIVQGRYDMVCPAVSAYELHKAGIAAIRDRLHTHWSLRLRD
jgi:proline iminopeptidase